MARKANELSPNQTDKRKFTMLKHRIAMAGKSKIEREGGVSRETVRRWVNGLPISPASESTILATAERIILAKGGPAGDLKKAGDEVIRATSAYV